MAQKNVSSGSVSHIFRVNFGPHLRLILQLTALSVRKLPRCSVLASPPERCGLAVTAFVAGRNDVCHCDVGPKHRNGCNFLTLGQINDQ